MATVTGMAQTAKVEMARTIKMDSSTIATIYAKKGVPTYIQLKDAHILSYENADPRYWKLEGFQGGDFAWVMPLVGLDKKETEREAFIDLSLSDGTARTFHVIQVKDGASDAKVLIAPVDPPKVAAVDPPPVDMVEKKELEACTSDALEVHRSLSDALKQRDYLQETHINPEKMKFDYRVSAFSHVVVFHDDKNTYIQAVAPQPTLTEIEYVSIGKGAGYGSATAKTLPSDKRKVECSNGTCRIDGVQKSGRLLIGEKQVKFQMKAESKPEQSEKL
jgi:hypothetical protein